MRNKTTNPVQQNNEELVVAFQEFNGVILAKISNKKDKETFAYGATKHKAQRNAIRNFSLKYQLNDAIF